MSSKSNSKCPPPPSPTDMTKTVSNMLNSLGASNKCKSNFNSATDNKEMTTAMAGAFLSPAAFGFGGGSATATENKFAEKLTKDGCSDVFANISQHITSSNNVLCTLNNSKNVTSIAGSQSSKINIVTREPSKEQIKDNLATIKLLNKHAPVTDAVKFAESLKGLSSDVSMALIAMNKAQVEAHDRLLARFAPPSIKIIDSTIKNVSTANMQVIQDTSKISKTQLVAQAKKLAQSTAQNQIKNKTGLGGNSPNVKQLVENTISDRENSLSTSIQNTLNTLNVNLNQNNEIDIIASGNIDIENVTFDQFSQSRILTNNILQIATDMGENVANDIIQKSASASSSSTTAGGQAEVLKQIFDGFEKTIKANADGAKGLIGSITSFLSFGLIAIIAIAVLVLMFFPDLLKDVVPGAGQGGAAGIIGMIIMFIIIYIIVAWFFSWWPFHKNKMGYDWFNGKNTKQVVNSHRYDTMHESTRYIPRRFLRKKVRNAINSDEKAY